MLGYGWNLNITSISATKCAPYVYEFKTPDNASHWLRFNGGKYRSEAWILAEKRNQLFVTSTCGKEVTISNGRVRRIKFSSGAQVNYNYDDKGRFMRELDANGRVAAYAVADDINYCIYRDGKLVFEEVAGKGVVEKNYYMDSGTRMCRKFFDSGDSEYFTYGKDGTLCYYEYRDAGERVLKKMFEYGFITEDVSENEKRITDVSRKLVAIVKKGADGSFRIQNKVNN